MPLWLLLSTFYTLDSELLIVRSGPLKLRIPVWEIPGIPPTHGVMSSPALSLERLRIDYSKFRGVMISPRDQDRFLRQIEALRARTA